jgi:hypothetical protein
MAQVVEVPGQGNVEFPDGMSDQDIARVIRLHTPEPEAKGSPEWAQWRNQRVSDLNDAATSPSKPFDQGFFHGLWQAVNPFPAVGELVAGKNPQTGKYGGPIQGAMNLVGNVGDAATEQAQKAKAAWDRGEHVEAAGHALAAVLPVVGPAAANAGEAIGEGRTGEGLGQAAGLLGTVEAGRIVHGAGATADALAPAVAKDAIQNWLRTGGETEYARALAPTTRANKAITAQVVPELIDRGVTAATLKGLQAQAQTHIGALGAAIGEAWDKLPPGTSTELAPVYDRLQNAIEDVHSVESGPQTKTVTPPPSNVLGPNGQPVQQAPYTVTSTEMIPKGPEAARAISNLKALQQTLTDVSETDPVTGKTVVPVDKVVGLRRYFDDIAARAGRYQGKDLADQSTAEAHGIAADAIREQLAQDHPDIAALNKEYSFWKNVNQVVTDTITRKQGQAPSLGTRVAQAAGFVKGGVLGAEAAKTLAEATASPAWRTVDAVLKDRLADALAKGQRGPAEFYISKAAAALAAGSPALTAGTGTEP